MNRKILGFLAAAAICAHPLRAQVYLSGAHNAGLAFYDFSFPEIIDAAPATGVGYVANNGGAFYHHGPAAATLTVNGLYNAYNPSVAGFTATPGNPGVDWFTGYNNAGSGVEIAGSVAPVFGILNLANGTGNNVAITNTAGADIGSQVNFSSGITTTIRSATTTGALRFLDGASYTSSQLGDGQYVNGYVTKTGNTSFVFPVGDQSGTDLRTLSMSAPTGSTDAISVAYWQGDVATALDPTGGAHNRATISAAGATGSTKIVSVSPIGFWDWVPVSGTSNVAVTVSIPDFTGIGGYAVPSEMRLVGWNTTTNEWENLSGNTGASGTTEGSLLSGTVSDMSLYSAIGVGNIQAIPLPLQTESFSVTMDVSCNALLNWKVQSANIEKFVLKYSVDGVHFTAIAEVAALEKEQRYSYKWAGASKGAGYYHLEIHQSDGKRVYSNIVRADNNCGIANISVSPNPTKDIVWVKGLKAGSTISVLNSLGQTISVHNVAEDNYKVSLEGLSSGVYILKIATSNNANVTNVRVVKQ